MLLFGLFVFLSWFSTFWGSHFYWAAREGNAQSRNGSLLCRKKTKWLTELPEGFACPIPASMGPIFAGRGRVISGLLADRFGSRFGTNTNLLRGVIGPISTRNDYLNTVIGNAVSLRGSCRNKRPSYGPHGKSFNLLQFSPFVWKVFPYKKGICYLQIAPSNRNIFTCHGLLERR